MISYIITNEDVTKKADIIKLLAEKIGIVPATNVVNGWFDNYDNFIFETETGAVLTYKSRVHGDWKVNTDVLQDYRFKKQ